MGWAQGHRSGEGSGSNAASLPVVSPEAHMEEFSSQDFPAEPEVLPFGHRSGSEAQSQLTDTSDPTKTLGFVVFLYKPHQNALKTHPGEPFVLPQLRREDWDNSRGPRITPRSCQVLPAPSPTCHNPKFPSRHPGISLGSPQRDRDHAHRTPHPGAIPLSRGKSTEYKAGATGIKAP